MVLVELFNSKAESVYLTDLLDKNDIHFIWKSEDGGGNLRKKNKLIIY